MIFSEIIFYSILFIALYIQVFFLLTFFEHREILKRPKKQTRPKRYPSTTIIIPCWNEENTLSRTVLSLLALDYPKSKLRVFIVNDGSTDETLKVAKGFEMNPQVSVFTKENGGKHTALNLGIENTDTELVGCLDADSYVAENALLEVVKTFENEGVDSVIPAIRISHPKSIIQLVQKAEYNTGVFLRKAFSLLSAIQITPGPFSIFKRSVFLELGPYHRAHNTEDMELALRLQSHGYKIGNAHRAFAYTEGPRTFPALFHQRVRWIYGYIMNVFDYRHMLFNRKYGNVGMIVLPAAFFGMITTAYFISLIALGLFHVVSDKILQIQAVGFGDSFGMPSFDWFTVSTSLGTLLILFAISATLIIVFTGKKMAENKWRPSLDILLFVLLYGYMAFTWIFKGVYNAALARGKETWR